jgi:hypothetical protein
MRDPKYATATAIAGLTRVCGYARGSRFTAVVISSRAKPSGVVAAAATATQSVVRGGLGMISGNRMMIGVVQVTNGNRSVRCPSAPSSSA